MPVRVKELHQLVIRAPRLLQGGAGFQTKRPVTLFQIHMRAMTGLQWSRKLETSAGERVDFKGVYQCFNFFLFGKAKPLFWNDEIGKTAAEFPATNVFAMCPFQFSAASLCF